MTISIRCSRTGAWEHRWFYLPSHANMIEMAKHVDRHRDTHDVYFSTCPAGKRPEDSHLLSRRIATKDVSAVVAFFMDIDTQEDESKVGKDVPISKEIALQKLRSLKYPPNLLIDSGNGIHAYWLLDSPLHVHDGNREQSKMMLRSFARSVAAEMGYTGLDVSASEPYRILRVPSTWNHKHGQAQPVKFISVDKENRYDINVLVAEYCSRNVVVSKAVSLSAFEHCPPEVLSDTECIEQVMRSKKGAALWNGTSSAYVPDSSRADMTLCIIILEATDGNIRQADRLFRRSKLFRPKWDEPGHTSEGHTYGQITLLKALAHVEGQRQKARFLRVRQFPLVNTLTKILVKDSDIQANGDALIPLGSIARLDSATLQINGYATVRDALKPMTQTVWRLFLTLLMLYTKQSEPSQTIRLEFKAYARQCGASDIKHIREQVHADVAYLQRMSISYHEKARGKKGRLIKKRMSLFGDVSLYTGCYEFTFSDEFFRMIDVTYRKMYMHCPVEMWQLNAGQYPHSFFFILKLAEYTRINLTNGTNVMTEDGKMQVRPLSIRALTAASPLFPSLEDVRAKGRHVKRQIFDAFQKNMNALSPVLTWEYHYEGVGVLSHETVSGFSHDMFMRTSIIVVWNEYPDCTDFMKKGKGKVVKK